MADFKRITLTEVEKAGPKEPIWVINTSSTDKRGRVSKVVVTVPRAGAPGDYDNVVIPSTFIPICLTNQVRKSALMDSSDFRRAHNKGLFDIIDSEQAEKFMASGKARAEVERLAQEELVAEAEAESNVLAATGEPLVAAGKGMDNSNNDVNPAIMDILLQAEGKTEEQVSASLKTVKGKSEADLRYIIREAGDLKMDSVVRRATKSLAKLQAVDEDEDDE